MIRFVICFCLLLSLQATASPRDYITSFSLQVSNQLNKPLQNVATHHITGETIKLMRSVAASTEALFTSVNKDRASDVSTSGLISFQLTDRDGLDFGTKHYLTLLWSVPYSEERNVLKLAITTGDAQQDVLYDDLLNDRVETFSVETGNSWQVWKPNFANLEIEVFCNNEHLASASIKVIRRTPDFPASLMILPLNPARGGNTVIELFDDRIQEGTRVSPNSKRQLWKIVRAYDDVFYIVNQNGTQFIYANKTAATVGSIFASDFEPENNNNLWEIKKVPYGFTIRAVVADLFWRTSNRGDSLAIVLTPMIDFLNARSVHIFTTEVQDFLFEDSFSVLTITDPSDSLALTVDGSSGTLESQSPSLLYDSFWLMRRIGNGKYILQDFDSHLTLEAVDQDQVQVRTLVPSDDTRAEFQLWNIIRGLGDDDFTIESVAYPGRFLSISDLGTVLGGSYDFQIERVDSSRDVIQKEHVYSLVARNGNTLTYDISGPKSSVPESIDLNHRFNFSESDVAQITPLASIDERLTLAEDSSLVWQQDSSDAWKIIQAANYYGILFQLQNERTGVYLSATSPSWTTTLDQSDLTTYFRAYSVDILP